ncbi:MAG: zf-HC2 domain-containing protein [Acidobacteriaceae bacterium]|nr:zf-HC2 domain-containing protein [Acidobacteriaceae bacterium]
MTCSDVNYLLPLYLAGDLDSATMAQVDRHAEACALCSRLVEDHASLDRAIAFALPIESVDTSAVQARVRQEIYGARTVPRFIPQRWIMFAAAAMLLCMVAGSLVFMKEGQFARARLDHVDEVVLHRRSWLFSDKPAIQRMVAERVGTSGSAAQLSIPGYELVHGKECSIAGRRYVHLEYAKGTQRISVYFLNEKNRGPIWKLFDPRSMSIQTRSEDGYNVTEGDANGHRILLVGAISPAEEQSIVGAHLSLMG